MVLISSLADSELIKMPKIDFKMHLSHICATFTPWHSAASFAQLSSLWFSMDFYLLPQVKNKFNEYSYLHCCFSLLITIEGI